MRDKIDWGTCVILHTYEYFKGISCVRKDIKNELHKNTTTIVEEMG